MNEGRRLGEGEGGEKRESEGYEQAYPHPQLVTMVPSLPMIPLGVSKGQVAKFQK